jgi:hypothetical protein
MRLVVQLRLDFTHPILPTGDEKKTELISFRAGSRFKDDLGVIARAKGVDLSALIFEYAI